MGTGLRLGRHPLTTRGTRLGVFALDAPFARGGMAEVWRARHGPTSQPVVVKVMTPDASKPELAEALQNEIRAVAALSHPHIIRIHDAGVVGPDAVASSLGALRSGSPWYAMELMPGGTLLDRAGALDFDAVRGILVDLLGALAHAHARGLLHRDLKPANVLFTRSEGGSAVLSDFGMALAMDRDERALAGGTPSWSAPEQISADASEQGPWTDLYAIGCLAWWLLCGRRPFSGPTARATLLAHLTAPIPPLDGRFPLPDGLDAWVAGLLQNAPEDRWRRAADASWALQRLDRPTATGPRGPTTAYGVDTRPTVVFDGETLAARTPEPIERLAYPAQAPDTAVARAPVPQDWRSADRPPKPAFLAGAGLGLYALREPSLIGRDDTCDALWSALLQAVELGRPVVRVLSGPAGVGKTRLAQWLCRRAHEVGAATVLRATHDRTPGPRHGIAGLLARAHRVLGQPDAQLLPVLRDQLRRAREAEAHWEAAALHALIRPGVRPARGRPVRLDSARERHEVTLRSVRRTLDGRPGILWIDDAQWGPDTVDFAAFACERAADPILVVATARDEALAAEPAAAAALEVLLARPEADELPLTPLGTTDLARLVRSILPVHDQVAELVDERCGGNALHAVQLVGDWVQRGLLVVTRRGLALPEGAPLPLPAALADTWRDRVAPLVASGPRTWGTALALAALLGRDVDGTEWRAACASAGIAAPAALVGRLLDQRLAVRDTDAGDRWSFVHGMLQEALAVDAGLRPDAAALHAACAAALQSQPAESERRAVHLAAAGAWSEAVDAVDTAVALGHRENRLARILDLGLELLKRHTPGPDLREVQLRHSRIEHALYHELAPERAEDLIRAQERLCTGPLGDLATASVHTARAQVALARGDMHTARSEAREAARHALRTTDGRMLRRAHGVLGLAEMASGDPAAAVEAQRAALAHAGDRATRINHGLELCLGLAAQGRFDEARPLLAELREDVEAEGSPRSQARLLEAEGATAYCTGDFAGACAAWRQMERVEQRRGAHNPAPIVNQALVHLRMGALDEAEAALARHARVPDMPPRQLFFAQLLRVGAAAQRGRWSRVGRLLDGLGRPLMRDHDLALVLGDAARAAEAAGAHTLAERLRQREGEQRGGATGPQHTHADVSLLDEDLDP